MCYIWIYRYVVYIFIYNFIYIFICKCIYIYLLYVYMDIVYVLLSKSLTGCIYIRACRYMLLIVYTCYILHIYSLYACGSSPATLCIELLSFEVCLYTLAFCFWLLAPMVSSSYFGWGFFSYRTTGWCPVGVEFMDCWLYITFGYGWANFFRFSAC